MDFITNLISSTSSKSGSRNTSKKTPSTRTTRKSIKQMNCNPLVKKKKHVSGSCYTDEILLKLRNEYNQNHPERPITTKEPSQIWKDLHMNLMYCKKEDCFLKQVKDEKLRKKLDELSFAPDSPQEWKKNPNEWLSNYDIMNVMKQYEQTYPHFRFLGPSPIDFDAKPSDYNGQCVTDDICNLSIKEQMDKGITKIGIVFNLDKHDQGGSHWVSLFIDLDEKVIFYFDSNGVKIPNEIRTLSDRIVKQASELSPPKVLTFYENRKAHQRENTECGMYSLFFNITMLTGETDFDKKMTMKDKLKLFRQKRIPDKYVENYRHIYFNS